jgi:hypothetical protein
VRRWLRWLARLAAVAVILVVGAFGFWFRSALYNRFVHFPREEAAWQRLRAQRYPVAEDAGWQEFRGILHSHSALSHDCEVPFEEILRVLQASGIDLVCLSDRCVEGRADFSLQWRGLRDGKLFVPGFEMKGGFMPFGVAAGVVLSNAADSGTLAREFSEAAILDSLGAERAFVGFDVIADSASFRWFAEHTTASAVLREDLSPSALSGPTGSRPWCASLHQNSPACSARRTT